MRVLKSPKYIAGIIGIVFIVSSLFYYLSTTASAVYLIVNGEKLGLASNGEKMVQEVLTEYGQPVGQVAQTKQKLEYQKVRINKGVLDNESINKQEIVQILNPYVDGYTFEVSGETAAILSRQEDIQTVQEKLKNAYNSTDNSKKITSVEITDRIITQKIETQPEKIKSPDDVVTMLKKGKQTVKEYVVQQDDSWWLIARKNNMLTKEVLEGNPEMTEDSPLQPGQKIKLVSITPYLNVLSKGEYTSTETIPFNVLTKTDYNLPGGQTKVQTAGSDGSKIVTYSFVEKNGQITEKNILKEQITQEPVDQVVIKGPTIVAKASRGSVSLSRGSAVNRGLSWPLRGPITSYYGWRSGGFHYGIDIDGYTGDPIEAAAPGKVVEAGSAGNYGLMVLIDNGNGIATRYSHASKLLVSPGQSVNQGQTIALVGSTGRSTGSHLDFEVLINGTNVNPLNYLP